MNKLSAFAKSYIHHQDGISISARSTYMQGESNLIRNRHVFRYQINILNNRKQAVLVASRYWAVADANNKKYEVSGEGVVGKKPVIESGKSFTYNSFCVLYTFSGSMRGYFTIQSDEGNGDNEGGTDLKIRTPTIQLHSHLLN